MERVELHLHTNMSHMDGINSCEEYIEKAKEYGMAALAITDHSVVQAFPKAQNYLEMITNDSNFKVLYGMEGYYSPNNNIKEGYHISILVKNKTGLKNLYKLVSIANLQYFYKRPRILKKVLDENREGLLIGSACDLGELYQAIIKNKTDEELERIASYYDYLEIQPIGNNYERIVEGRIKNEEELQNINLKIVELGTKLNKLVVATSDVHFMDSKDEIYRKILQEGQGYEKADNQPPLYFRTTEEMLKEFKYLGKEKAYEVVITNTNKIADMCEKIKPLSNEKCYPYIANSEKEIKELTYSKAYKLYGRVLPKEVQARLDKELNSITENNFATLYMIAQKLVKKANEDKYVVGNRGYISSSLVAYLIDITEVNPLQAHYRCNNCKYADFTDYGIENGIDLPNKLCPKCGNKLEKEGMNIPFESLSGINYNKEPDIDLNFAREYQEKAQEYIKTILEDVTTYKAGTIQRLPIEITSTFVKQYFEEKQIPISMEHIINLSQKLTEVKSTTSKQPGGIIVVPKDREIYEFTPIQYKADEKNSDIITHFDYHCIDHNLLKLDILEHGDPTILHMLFELTGIDPTTIPLDDKETMSIFTSTKILDTRSENKIGTYGIPEFETKFVRRILEETKPTTLNELIKISGLVHGKGTWQNNASDLIKSGTITLEDTISCSDDIILYLMKQGISIGKSYEIMELISRGVTSKRNWFDKWKEYTKLMKRYNVPDWYIKSCERIKYLFPKAHATSYVINEFRIAWYKVHYPSEFYTSYFKIRTKYLEELKQILNKGTRTEVIQKMQELKSKTELTDIEEKLQKDLQVALEMYNRGIKYRIKEKIKNGEK